MGKGGEDTAIRLPDPASPSLSSSAEPTLRASAEPPSCAEPSSLSAEGTLSTDPSSSAEPTLSAEPSFTKEPTLGADPSSSDESILSAEGSAQLSYSAEGVLCTEQSIISAVQSTLSAEPSSSAEGIFSAEPSSSPEPSSSAEPSSRPINNQPPSKRPFVSKPPQRRRIGIGRKSKQSKYNYEAARASLNVPHAHHFQIYSAALSSNVSAIDVNHPAISQRDMLHTIATDLERKLESSNNKIKTEKLKSRSMMEQLLLLTTTQTEELIGTFHERFTQLKTEYDSAVCKLQRMSDSEQIDNQKSIKRLLRSHDKQMK
jgi:hypothetical protein